MTLFEDEHILVQASERPAVNGHVCVHAKKVLDEMDHKCLNDIEYFKDGRPSAERIAKYIYDSISKMIAPLSPSNVDVFETDKCMASYSK